MFPDSHRAGPGLAAGNPLRTGSRRGPAICSIAHIRCTATGGTHGNGAWPQKADPPVFDSGFAPVDSRPAWVWREPLISPGGHRPLAAVFRTGAPGFYQTPVNPLLLKASRIFFYSESSLFI